MALATETRGMHFVLIDDDDVSNMVAISVLKRHLQIKEFTIFTNPAKALHFLQTVTTPVVVLLDINMPIMTGWEVLREIEKFPSKTVDLLSIYIVSSSIDIDDHERAAHNQKVLGYLEKPISTAQIIKHFGDSTTI